MKCKSIRDLDSLSDRIRLHRQVDARGILVVEGPSDQRFIKRLFSERWMTFIAGTRNVVISTIEETVSLRIQRTAGIVDQDFDGVVIAAQARGLPIFQYQNADLEAALFVDRALNNLLEELASDRKLASFGGIDALRKVAISVAVEIAALRAENTTQQWRLPFDRVDLSRKIDRNDLSFKRSSYCQALAEACPNEIHHSRLHDVITEKASRGNTEIQAVSFFSGKDALTVVGVALKNKVGTCETDVTRADHLGRVLRLSAPDSFAEQSPFPEIASMIDAA